MTNAAHGYVDVIGIADLPAGTQKAVFVGVTRVLLCHTNQGLFALEDKCSHAFQPLAGGNIENGAITCPKHGACFSLASGKPLNDVAKRAVKTFGVRVRAQRIEVQSNAAVV